MSNLIRWINCPICSEHLDLAGGEPDALACAACGTIVTIVDNECLYREPGHAGAERRCVLERLISVGDRLGPVRAAIRRG